MLRCEDGQFIDIVADSVSLAQVIKKCSMIATYGGTYRSTKNRIKKLNLDMSHFTGQGTNKGKSFGYKRPIEDYLENKVKINSHNLRVRILAEGLLKEECSKCKRIEWGDQPIPLELHHIDCDHSNNNITNLKVLCPNCHATTHKSGSNILPTQ